jgi:hypothetical protein
MRGVARRAAPPFIILVGALVLVRAIYAFPDAMPAGLVRVGHLFVDALGTEGVEAALNAEFAFVLAISLAASALLYGLARVLLALARR